MSAKAEKKLKESLKQVSGGKARKDATLGGAQTMEFIVGSAAIAFIFFGLLLSPIYELTAESPLVFALPAALFGVCFLGLGKMRERRFRSVGVAREVRFADENPGKGPEASLRQVATWYSLLYVSVAALAPLVVVSVILSHSVAYGTANAIATGAASVGSVVLVSKLYESK